MSAEWTPTGEKQALTYLWRIGAAVFVGALPELSTSTVQYIKESSPFPYTFVGEMFDGGDYNMPCMWDYEDFTHAALDGTYWPGSAEIWAERLIQDLSRLWP